MDAVVLEQFGGPECLRIASYQDPTDRAGWSIVRLRAAALNWHDVLVRRGTYGSTLPHVLGADGAGIHEATGDEVMIVPSLAWGEDEAAPSSSWEILGDYRPGTYATRVSVPTECLFAKPTGWSWAEAAALPLVGLTCYRALFSRAQLQPGESVLILGAGGGVATMALTLAGAAGCHVVVTSSADDKIDQSVLLGAVGGVRYDRPNWAEAARQLSPAGRGFDVVLDAVGSWSDSLSAMRSGGRLVVLGASLADTASIDVRRFYFGQFSLLGTTMGSPADFGGLLRFIDEHSVRAPVVDRTYPLSRAADAHAYLESGTAFGKVTLDIPAS